MLLPAWVAACPWVANQDRTQRRQYKVVLLTARICLPSDWQDEANTRAQNRSRAAEEADKKAQLQRQKYLPLKVFSCLPVTPP